MQFCYHGSINVVASALRVLHSRVFENNDLKIEMTATVKKAARLNSAVWSRSLNNLLPSHLLT